MPPGRGTGPARAEGEQLMNADVDELALTARNASIEDLVALLRGQQARKTSDAV